MATGNANQGTGRDTWTRTEPPPRDVGEPQGPRDAWDARLAADGGQHR